MNDAHTKEERKKRRRNKKKKTNNRRPAPNPIEWQHAYNGWEPNEWANISRMHGGHWTALLS